MWRDACRPRQRNRPGRPAIRGLNTRLFHLSIRIDGLTGWLAFGRLELDMNSDRGTFEDLRRLLALKRYERPPPGYFERFPREVIARIRERESAAGLALLQPLKRWLQDVWDVLETKAVCPAAFGAAVCAALILGLTRPTQGHTRTVPLTRDLAGVRYAPEARPLGMPRVERAVLQPSTAGVLPDQPSFGIFRDLRG